MKTRGLPGTFAPTYQELARGQQGRVGHLVDVRHPGLLGLRIASITADTVGAQPLQRVGDPVHVLLDGHHHVGEHRRAARPGDQEQVREAGHRQPEVGARPRGPGLLQRAAAAAADVDRQQGPGHRVEAGGEHDRVDRVLGAARHDPARGDPLDRLGLDVDERDVVPVERLEVVRVDADALAAEREALRGQSFSATAGSCDRLADLVARRTPARCRWPSRPPARR